jgi:hypothetical protein
MDIDPSWAVHAKLAFAAFCGGMTRLLFRPAATFLKTVWLLFGCMTCGYYGTPLVMHWWTLDSSYVGAVGASIGFIGLSVAEAALRSADKLDLREWLRSLLAKKEA